MASVGDLSIPDGETLGKMKHRHKMELKKCQQEGKALLKNKKIPKKEAKAQAAKLESDMKERHAAEIAYLESQLAGGDEPGAGTSSPAADVPTGPASRADPGAEAAATPDDDGGASKKSRAKARRDRKKAKEEAIRAAIAEEKANTVDPRVTEIAAINKKLEPLGLAVFDVPADGNCLFRSIEHQLKRSRASASEAVPGHKDIRTMVAEHIRARGAEFGPFLPYEDEDRFESDPAGALARYCDRLASTAVWGGEPEVRAAADALGKPIVVVQAEGNAYGVGPGAEKAASAFNAKRDAAASGGAAATGVTSGEGGGDHGVDTAGCSAGAGARPLLLAFHREYYALGEHYNSVALAGSEGTTDGVVG